MQDMILLGFLMDKEHTGYEMKKAMESSTEYFFNTSLGSIYPAFKKLVNNKLAKVDQSIEDGRVKKTYSITNKGKEKLEDWLSITPPLPKYREEALLKVFFFSHLSTEKRTEMINNYITKIELLIEELKSIDEEVKGSVDEYKYQALQYGIEYYSFVKNWYKKFMDNKLLNEVIKDE